MARPLRIILNDALYHAISRGNNKEFTFIEESDFSYYLSLLSKYKEKYNFQLLCYALMPNHAHLLIETSEQGTIAKIMQGINLSYTLYFNKKYDRVGHVFQGRYKSFLVQKERYLLELSRYIHLNPVRANLVIEPAQYLYTSYLDYIDTRRSALVDTKQILSRFRAKKAQNRSYELFIKATKPIVNLQNQIKYQAFLGSEDFVSRIRETTPKEKGAGK